MKKITSLLFLLLTFAATAQITLTHSTSMELGETNLVACNGGATSSDNRYFRFFDLSEFNITSDLEVESVDFGINLLNSSLMAGFPIHVKVYSTSNSDFPANFPADYTELATANFFATSEHVGTLVSVPITATIPIGSNLLVEVGYAAQEADSNNLIFLSANEEGETAPTYLMSQGCSITSPVTMASINFPNNAFILSVTAAGTMSVNNPKLDVISIYPNPSAGKVNFVIPQNIILENASLTDMRGKEIKLVPENNSIDISRFASGIYVLKLTTDQGIATRKIVKE